MGANFDHKCAKNQNIFNFLQKAKVIFANIYHSPFVKNFYKSKIEIAIVNPSVFSFVCLHVPCVVY